MRLSGDCINGYEWSVFVLGCDAASGHAKLNSAERQLPLVLVRCSMATVTPDFFLSL
jgi:hypothetical protein